MGGGPCGKHGRGGRVRSVTLGGVEAVEGDFGNDSLTGNAAANRLIGGFGSDLLSGGGGADTLVGATGVDTLVGGTGPTCSSSPSSTTAARSKWT
ncbi:MAG: hypothetical protein HZT43_15745 [Exiguobacterium profundum]|nr:MAG: hypothetical protein HZT43_15745 [Exiguobacterium profundum]